MTTNFSGGDPMLVNAAAFDYHLKPARRASTRAAIPEWARASRSRRRGSTCIRSSAQGRTSVGTIDIGAYEVGGGTDAGPDGLIGVGPGWSGR